MSARTTLNPGDLIYWTSPDPSKVESSLLLVSDDGQELLFQFAPKPWSQMHFRRGEDLVTGLTVTEAQEVLRGEREFPLEGRIYKAYDARTDIPFTDPVLEDE